MNKYPIVTLCGSTKFKEDFLKATEELSLSGHIVLSVGLFGHADNKYETVINKDVKKLLDDLHRHKIDMSDFVYIINKDDYIGESTKAEIEYAKSKGKEIKYMYDHKEG